MLPPRTDLLLGPTPLVRLDRFSAAVSEHGPAFWIKRDDLTGLAAGGNKLRKLEYFMADALSHGASHVITLGAEQSNHACQTAAAARRVGLEPVLLLKAHLNAPRAGNLLLDDLFGADVRLDPAPQPDWADKTADELRAAGHRPYVIPYGGSNALGALGYLRAGDELARQAKTHGVTFQEILVTSSSGGTQAGLVLAHASGHLHVPVLGISVDLEAPRLSALVRKLAAEAATRFSLPQPTGTAVEVSDAYIGPGYARLDERTRAAIQLLARTEGIVTDPVYTGKMVAATIDLARSGRWQKGAPVLLWHTGGMPALFAYGLESLGEGGLESRSVATTP